MYVCIGPARLRVAAALGGAPRPPGRYAGNNSSSVLNDSSRLL